MVTFGCCGIVPLSRGDTDVNTVIIRADARVIAKDAQILVSCGQGGELVSLLCVEGIVEGGRAAGPMISSGFGLVEMDLPRIICQSKRE